MGKYLRSLDALGRISIPSEILRENLFEDGTLFYIKAVPEGILLVPSEGLCALCGKDENLIETAGAFICRTCIKEAVDNITDN